MLSRLISSTHRITVDIEAVLTKRISIISLNLKYCLLQNIAISVTFLELYTLSFLIFRLWTECETWTLIYFIIFFKTLKQSQFVERLKIRLLFCGVHFADDFSLYTKYVFCSKFLSYGVLYCFFGTVELSYLFLTVMATSSVDSSFYSSFSPTKSARTW